MKILSVTSLQVPDVKVFRNARFHDGRGYFTEVYRDDEILGNPELKLSPTTRFMQANESISKGKIIRGLHFQVNPNLSKLVRLIEGHIIDVAIDVRPNSATFGVASAYELIADTNAAFEDMVWIPFGFAHGLFILEPSRVQYVQTGYWNGAGEVSITPQDSTLNWTYLSKDMQNSIHTLLQTASMSDKDKAGISLTTWKQYELSSHLV
ncbi:MAG: dTDP-4-dehydrorhamnose 3,5-epimerase family protein [Candidatus Roizmanbacteria bacterium]